MDENTEPLEPPQHCGRTKPHLGHETVDGLCPGHTGPPQDRPLPLLDRFSYHAPTPEQIPIYELIRDTGYLMALTIEAVAKPCGETTRAYAAIDNVVMLANAAVARHGLADPGYAGAAEVHELALSTVAQTRQGSPLIMPSEPGLWNGSAATGRVLDDVQDERARQIDLGWTPEHDDTHTPGQLLTLTRLRLWHVMGADGSMNRAELVKAAALAVATIEMIDREAARG